MGKIMDLQEKARILSDVALAYLDRGNAIQYDQRCMDRSLFLTPRRIKLIPPEAATPQNKVYLDCSSFVGAVYYEAFGYELPADLTWHIIDLVKPRIFFYEFTHSETDKEKAKIESDIRGILHSGDVIVFDRVAGSGHTVLYLGNNKFIHCTSNKRPDSYDYVNCKSREYDDGGLFIAQLDEIFSRMIFADNVRRAAILRPLSLLDSPTPKTLARIGMARGLRLGVTTSHPRMVNAEWGETVEYRLLIEETEGIKHNVDIDFCPPGATIPLTDTKIFTTIAPNESLTVNFQVKIIDEKAYLLNDGSLCVCGMDVFVPQVLIGKRISSSEAQAVTSGVEHRYVSERNLLKLVSDEYVKIGVVTEDSEQKVIQKLFYLHDSPSGDVLSRRAQTPFVDGAVYSFFGGTGVVTPEMISYPFIRTNQITDRDFLEGDIIIISNDACANNTYSAYYTGEALIGIFDSTKEIRIIKGEEVNSFFDSLLGKFCFVVLRPSLKK